MTTYTNPAHPVPQAQSFYSAIQPQSLSSMASKQYSQLVKSFLRLVQEDIKLMKKVRPLNSRLLQLLEGIISLLKNNDFISNISKLDMDNFEDV